MAKELQELIRSMTLAEKASFLSGADEWHSHAIERLGIPALTLSDGPSGLRKQAGAGDHLGLNASTKATCIPAAAALANSWDMEAAEEAGRIVGADARAQGVQVLLGPGINTKRSPLCGRSFEYYSEDPYLAGKLSGGFIRGVQANGISACVKHFAANSQEMLRMSSDSVMDERTLREMYLTNFEIAVKEGKPRTLMTSYNKVNGTYTNENAHLLKDILRGEWQYDGMVVTDWGGSNSYVEGVRAGMNLEMPVAGDDSACQLVDAVKKGEITEAEVDERVEQLLKLIMSMKDQQPVAVDPAKQHAHAGKIAEKTVVLLKNENHLLPLAQETKMAVIGDFAETPRYQGAGSSMVNAYEVDNAAGLMKEYFPQNIGFSKGFERTDTENAALLDEAVALAKQADVALVYLGLPESFETEGLDRTHMRLPKNQQELLHRVHEVNAHVVVVLSCGSAVEMPWIDDCEALVYACLGGEAGASAVLKVLTGEVNPGGKLAETFALTYEDDPVSRYYPGLEKTSEYREGLYVRYRYFATAEKPVRFPFGFGLSYTTFRYDDLTVTDTGVSFTLTNTGACDGDEIAQMYVSLPDAKIFRPALELKGFTRVHLKAGESKQITLPFDAYTFRYFNEKTNHWEVEGGDYQIHIAASAEDIRLTGTLHVQGTGAPDPYAGKELPSYRSGKIANVSDAEFEQLLGHKPPQKMWDRKAPLGMNDTVRQMVYAKNPICRAVARYLGKQVDKSVVNGKPDLNMLFIYNIPFRGMAKMMNGMVSMKMARSIMTIANGHFFKGVGGLIHGFFHRPKLK